MKRAILGSVIGMLVLLFMAAPVWSQSDLNSVRLFQSYFYDAPITKVTYGDFGLAHSSFDGGSSLFIGGQGGYGLNEKIEIQAQLGYLSWSFDDFDGQSGLADLDVYGRYFISNNGKTQISAGGLISLPIGSEDVGQSSMDLGGFGALRHNLKNGMVVTGSLGLISLEAGDEREMTIRLGAGAIYPHSKEMAFVGEFVTQTEIEYTMLSGGVDYLMGNGRIRGALGIGLADGAPDLQITATYGLNF
ncbi:hypothetical protein HQ585_10415 [candidate division KSB1 bacterium]|nr:hypothetical protein [candidate division KSB1 bacterium]